MPLAARRPWSARRWIVLVWVAVLCAVAASGCGPGGNPPGAALAGPMPLRGDFSGGAGVPGSLLSAVTLPLVDRRLSALTSVAARITYSSTSALDDGHSQVSGTVFAPQGDPPQGGWPVIAVGHPDLGILPECGPSNSPTLGGLSPLITTLVAAGYVVTLSDYQGLGTTRVAHPYLDSTTEGYNLIDSVRAARKLLPGASPRWVAVGVAQGGQAAWASNELVDNYGGGLALLGSVSGAPVTNLDGLVDAASTGELGPNTAALLQWYLAANTTAYGGFRLDDYRRGEVVEQWSALSACQGAPDRAAALAHLDPGDLKPVGVDAADTLRGFLRKTSLPLGPAAAPMLVVYGDRDDVIPAAWTTTALRAACEMGDIVEIRELPDGGHDIDLSATFGWIGNRFRGDAATNDCADEFARPAPAGSARP